MLRKKIQKDKYLFGWYDEHSNLHELIFLRIWDKYESHRNINYNWNGKWKMNAMIEMTAGMTWMTTSSNDEIHAKVLQLLFVVL
jgi:hypothetical protein